MSISAGIIQSYGESITVNGINARGFISVMDENKPDRQRRVFPAGIKNTLWYRLITDFPAPEEGMTVVCCEREYVILRVEPIRIFGELSHYECILGVSGGGADV